MSTKSSSAKIKLRPTGWCYYLGLLFFVLYLVMPLFIPLVPTLGFNKAITGILMSGFVIGGPELMMVIAIALWGKATFDFFMEKLFGLLKRLAPSGSVSAGRYYFGLVLLIFSCIPSWILAYFPAFVGDAIRIYILLTFDIVFIISFFVLGGDFWEKIRSLFMPNPITINKNRNRSGLGA